MNDTVIKTFHTNKPFLAMLHLNGGSAERIRARAMREIEQLYESGVDAVLAEDYYGGPNDVAWALDYLHGNYPDRVCGVNLLSDPEKGFRLAQQYGAAFLQIDSICGPDSICAAMISRIFLTRPVTAILPGG